MVYGLCNCLSKQSSPPVGDNNKVGINLIIYNIKSKVKLNNRNAFEIINALHDFNGAVYIEKITEKRRANAKFLLGLLSLGILVGDEIKIIIYNTNDDVKMLFDKIKSVLERE